jgi:hypothetical protein
MKLTTHLHPGQDQEWLELYLYAPYMPSQLYLYVCFNDIVCLLQVSLLHEPRASRSTTWATFEARYADLSNSPASATFH